MAAIMRRFICSIYLLSFRIYNSYSLLLYKFRFVLRFIVKDVSQCGTYGEERRPYV